MSLLEIFSDRTIVSAGAFLQQQQHILLTCAAAVIGGLVSIWHFYSHTITLFLCSSSSSSRRSAANAVGKYEQNEEDKKLELVLQGPSTFQLAIKLLRSSENRIVEEVALWNYSSHTTVKIMEVKEVVDIFEAIARLPHLKKLRVSFNSPLPIQSLSALLREQQRQHTSRKVGSWRSRWMQKQSATMMGLSDVHLSVLELSGSPTEKEDFGLLLRECESLDLLDVAFSHTESDDEEEILAISQRNGRNELDLIHILQALKCHKSLQELSLSAFVAKAPKEAAAVNGIEQSSPPCPLIQSLIALVQANCKLKTLKLLLAEEGKHDNGWYITPLALALSDSSLNGSSQLEHLEFRRSENIHRPQNWDRCLTRQRRSALATMIEHNYNIRSIHLGIHYVQDRVDRTSLNNACARTLRFYIQLNRLGRKRLLCDPAISRDDWVGALIESRDDLSRLFYWLSMHPTLCKS